MKSIMKRRHDGFTLIEVLAAVVVFAFGVLALYRLQGAGVQSNVFSNDLTLATTLAQDKMEWLLTLPYSSVTDTKGDGLAGIAKDVTDKTSLTPVSDADGNATVGRYYIYWNVVPDRPIEGTERIRVIVRWQRADKSWHSVALECVKPDII